MLESFFKFYQFFWGAGPVNLFFLDAKSTIITRNEQNLICYFVGKLYIIIDYCLLVETLTGVILSSHNYSSQKLILITFTFSYIGA